MKKKYQTPILVIENVNFEDIMILSLGVLDEDYSQGDNGGFGTFLK